MMRNMSPALALTIGIPAVAVVASFVTLGLSLGTSRDELPEQFHWEGQKLDRDFTLANRAAELNVRAMFSVAAAEGRCRVALDIAGPAPRALLVVLTHPTSPDLDRQIALPRVGDGYEAACAPVPPAHWRVSVGDIERTWDIRWRARGTLDRVAIVARDTPEDGS
jgi:hypothetical protein